MKCVRAELRKALHNPMFYLALLIGTAITMLNVWENTAVVKEITERIQQAIQNKLTVSYSSYGCSLFIYWIGNAVSSMGKTVFYFVWPILAAMPFGWSYTAERKSGVYQQIAVRSGKMTCYISKYLAVFVSGGLAVSIPVLVNLLVNALICPYALPKITSMLSLVSDGYFLSELYYSAPWAYALIWCGLTFVMGGATAGFCFIVGSKLRFAVLTVLVPFVTFSVIDGILQLDSRLYLFSPMTMVVPSGASPNPEWAVLTVLALVWGIGFIVGYFQVVKHELL